MSSPDLRNLAAVSVLLFAAGCAVGYDPHGNFDTGGGGSAGRTGAGGQAGHAGSATPSPGAGVGGDGAGGGEPSGAGGSAAGPTAPSGGAGGSGGAAPGNPGGSAGSAPAGGSGGGAPSPPPPSGPIEPQTCTDSNDSIGCCDASGDLYYCTSSGSTPTMEACTGGTVCGWDDLNGWYGCVAPPGGADPYGVYPMACGGTSSGGSGGSGAGGAGGSGGSTPGGGAGGSTGACGATVTYAQVKAITSASCSGCHSWASNPRSHFTGSSTCGSKEVIPGDVANSSLLAKLEGGCGSTMPPNGSLSQSDLATITTWICEGAPSQ